LPTKRATKEVKEKKFFFSDDQLGLQKTVFDVRNKKSHTKSSVAVKMSVRPDTIRSKKAPNVSKSVYIRRSRCVYLCVISVFFSHSAQKKTFFFHQKKRKERNNSVEQKLSRCKDVFREVFRLRREKKSFCVFEHFPFFISLPFPLLFNLSVSLPRAA
jgi:hypothetical protein